MLDQIFALDGVLNFISDIEILVTIALSVTFTILYASLFHWRKTAAGRAVMYVFAVFILISATAALARWIGPEYIFREWVRFFTWTLAVLSFGNLVRVLINNLARGRSPLDFQRKDSRGADRE